MALRPCSRGSQQGSTRIVDQAHAELHLGEVADRATRPQLERGNGCRLVVIAAADDAREAGPHLRQGTPLVAVVERRPDGLELLADGEREETRQDHPATPSATIPPWGPPAS
jgi:hypothetical protein